MTTKVCTKCTLPKNRDEFAIKGSGRSSWCKKCHREYTKAHYSKDPLYYKAKARKVRADIRAYVDSLKRGNPCADCGNTYNPWQMDFDHVRGEKCFNLGTSPKKGSRKQVMAEAAKCDLVCANCHRQRTHERSCGGLDSGVSVAGFESPLLHSDQRVVSGSWILSTPTREASSWL